MDSELGYRPAWENVGNNRQAPQHYTVLRVNSGVDSMNALRNLFPEAEVDALNFVLFSTSGLHGTYNTIESAERAVNGDRDATRTVTFLVIHPRLVSLRYGVVNPTTQDDICFLKKLRENSQKVIASIGVPQ